MIKLVAVDFIAVILEVEKNYYVYSKMERLSKYLRRCEASQSLGQGREAPNPCVSSFKIEIDYTKSVFFYERAKNKRNSAVDFRFKKEKR